MTDDMAAAHTRDYNDHRRMQDMSRTIAAFLKDPPRRAHPAVRVQLAVARRELEEACAHIVAVWD